MATASIHPDRIHERRGGEPQPGRYVLYWMQASVRSQHNDALEYAIQRANDVGRRLLVAFVLDPHYPDANLRSLRFLVEGLHVVDTALARRKAKFVVQVGDPVARIADLARDACLLVMDRATCGTSGAGART